MIRALPLIALAMIIMRVGAAAAHFQIEPQWPRGNLNRGAIARQLQAMPGKQLVIVRYPVPSAHDVDNEWVYNAADIDHAKVVWARDLGAKQNLPLLQYFRDRTVWTVNGDESPAHLQPYRETPASEVMRTSLNP